MRWNEILGENSDFLKQTFIRRPLGGPVRILSQSLVWENLNGVAGEKNEYMISHFDRIHERDRQTDTA